MLSRNMVPCDNEEVEKKYYVEKECYLLISVSTCCQHAIKIQ